MVAAVFSSAVDLVSIAVWGLVVYKLFHMANEEYGDKFTSVYPSLGAAAVLFFLLGLIEFVHYEFIIQGRHTVSDMFLFGAKSFQLVAGIMLLQAVKKIYDINFATRGFMEE